MGVVNFNPYYRVYDPQHAIHQQRYASNIYQITCPVDVLSSDVQLSNVVSAITIIWLYTCIAWQCYVFIVTSLSKPHLVCTTSALSYICIHLYIDNCTYLIP